MKKNFGKFIASFTTYHVFKVFSLGTSEEEDETDAMDLEEEGKTLREKIEKLKQELVAIYVDLSKQRLALRQLGEKKTN